MFPGNGDTAIAILAKAPIPGLAKTRLALTLGKEGAAALQHVLIGAAVATACAAGTGPVTVWATPAATHPTFEALARTGAVSLALQPEGDLGARMLAAAEAADGAVLIIGTDCPALTPALLGETAAALAQGEDAALIPACDGGYVLIGLARPCPDLFSGIDWGTAEVADETRRRFSTCGWRWREWPPLPDIDRPDDLESLRDDARFAAILRHHRRGG
jgi:rSAM/selenodomain-associated transferase 1